MPVEAASDMLLFPGAVGAVGSEDIAAPVAAPKLPLEETIRFECDVCNRRFRITVQHYDKWICACERILWALRPKRFGPLVAFPWPGTPEMLSYKLEQLNGGRS